MNITVTDEHRRLAAELHDRVHERAALVTTNGVDVGWAPEDAIPMLAEALAEAEERGKRAEYQRQAQIAMELHTQVQ